MVGLARGNALNQHCGTIALPMNVHLRPQPVQKWPKIAPGECRVQVAQFGVGTQKNWEPATRSCSGHPRSSWRSSPCP